MKLTETCMRYIYIYVYVHYVYIYIYIHIIHNSKETVYTGVPQTTKQTVRGTYLDPQVKWLFFLGGKLFSCFVITV